MSKDLPTIDAVFDQYDDDQAQALMDDAAPNPRIKAIAQLNRIMTEERLDELRRHSYGKGQVSAYSINRRIAELETKMKGDE